MKYFVLGILLAACAAPRSAAPLGPRLPVGAAPQLEDLSVELPPPPLSAHRDDAAIRASFARATAPRQVLYLTDLLLAARIAQDASSRALFFLLMDKLDTPGSSLAGPTLALAQRARQAGLIGLARLHAQDSAEIGGTLGPGEAAMLRHQLSGGADPAAPAALLLRYGSCVKALREAGSRAARIHAAHNCRHGLAVGDPGALITSGSLEAAPAPDWAALQRDLGSLRAEAGTRALRLRRLLLLLREQEQWLFARLQHGP